MSTRPEVFRPVRDPRVVEEVGPVMTPEPTTRDGFDRRVGSLVRFLAFTFLLGTVRGWGLSIGWGWFVVPLGVRPITIAWAYGICLVWSLFTFVPIKLDGKGREVKYVNSLLQYGLVTLAFLAAGWVITTYFM
jgi:hypothetical protein